MTDKDWSAFRSSRYLNNASFHNSGNPSAEPTGGEVSDTPYWTNGMATLYQADARAIPLPDKSVHMCVTSPPYHGACGTTGWASGKAVMLGAGMTRLIDERCHKHIDGRQRGNANSNHAAEGNRPNNEPVGHCLWGGNPATIRHRAGADAWRVGGEHRGGDARSAPACCGMMAPAG